jgi:hypothetical protein
MLETKVFSEGHVYNLDGHGNEAPARKTDVRAGAARTNVIVSIHIDIEY